MSRYNVRRRSTSEPQRTCLGCHGRFPKSQLMKFTVSHGKIVHDSRGTGPGRSAYCCKDKKCLDVFCRQKKKLSRAFRVQEDQIRFELEDWE